MSDTATLWSITLTRTNAYFDGDGEQVGDNFDLLEEKILVVSDAEGLKGVVQRLESKMVGMEWEVDGDNDEGTPAGVVAERCMGITITGVKRKRDVDYVLI